MCLETGLALLNNLLLHGWALDLELDRVQGGSLGAHVDWVVVRGSAALVRHRGLLVYDMHVLQFGAYRLHFISRLV